MQLDYTGKVKCLLKSHKSTSFEIDRMKRIISSYCDLSGFQYEESNDDQFGDLLIVNMGNQPRRVSGAGHDEDFIHLLKDEIPVESLT